MKVLILSASGVEDIELDYPYYRLQEEGFDVVVASPGKQKIEMKMGYERMPDANTDDIDADEFDALVLPGGKGPELVRMDKSAVAITREFMEKQKPVAALCHGIQVLISAGSINGRRVTCWPALQDDARAAGAEWLDQEVVVDGNLVCSRMPEDLPAFMRESIKMFHKAEKEQMQLA